MILLKDCLAVATLDRKALLKGRDILIQGTLIRRIAKNINIENTETEIVEVIDCSNCIVVPGFINTHHHFYQVLTRNIPSVQNAGLFDWLTTLYEIWKRIDEEAVLVSSMAAIGELLKTGCTCTTDHHYLYPGNFSGDLMGIQFEAARRLGIRFSPARGSMSLSRKDGGLPPDSVVQSDKKILEDSLRVIETYHDPGVLSMR
jgi:cytosine/adenosine deaminase-related metal-dependent hydrolase